MHVCLTGDALCDAVAGVLVAASMLHCCTDVSLVTCCRERGAKALEERLSKKAPGDVEKADGIQSAADVI